MKVYYPFVKFNSRSKPGEVYIINIRYPDEISCTCGAWKYYRNKDGNNGTCMHTRAVLDEFKIELSNNPIMLSILSKNKTLLFRLGEKSLNSIYELYDNIASYLDLNDILNSALSARIRKDMSEKNKISTEKDNTVYIPITTVSSVSILSDDFVEKDIINIGDGNILVNKKDIANIIEYIESLNKKDNNILLDNFSKSRNMELFDSEKRKDINE